MIDPNVPWVLLRIREQLFAVPATHVREMAEMPAVTSVPNAPQHLLGLVTLRGAVIAAIDLRRRLGFPSAEEDLQKMTRELTAAGEEHSARLQACGEAWERGHAFSVNGGCPLDRWLREHRTRNPLVAAHLKKLEDPHAALHREEAALGDLVSNRRTEAVEALRKLRERQLPLFLQLLEQTSEQLAHASRQIVAVLTVGGRSLGGVVDEVESIERLKHGSITELDREATCANNGLTRYVGRRSKDDEPVLVLEVDQLFGTPQERQELEAATAAAASALIDGSDRAEIAPTDGSAPSAMPGWEAAPPAGEQCASSGGGEEAAESEPELELEAWCGAPHVPWVGGPRR